MSNKKDEELEKNCGCACGKECTCDDNCMCEDDCCCDDCCKEFEDIFKPLEEKLVLVGKKDDKQTTEAIKFLDKKHANYTFCDLNKDKDALNISEEVEIPSLLLVQTLVTDAAIGIAEIKEVFEENE